MLLLTIDEAGRLLETKVVQDPGYGFAAAALEAVKKSRFNPANDQGRAITVKAVLPIRFTLQGTD